MRYIFFGTPEFAAIILEKLIEAGMPPALVVTNPDKPVGRKQVLISPPVKEVAERHGISVLQPETLKTKNPAEGGVLARSKDDPIRPGLSLKNSIANQIEKSMPVDNQKGRGPAGNRTPETLVTIQVPDHPGPTTDIVYQDWDFFLVVAYGKIIPKEILEIPRLGVLNVHPSLLPKYRGPTPIQTTLLNGDTTTGVSIMLLDEEIDHGPILKISNFQFPISNETYASLSEKLAHLGADILIEVLPKYVHGKITPVPQEHEKATCTKKFTTEDAFVPYKDLAAALGGDIEKTRHIDRIIRALNPEPGVWTRTENNQILDLPKNKRVKLLEAETRGEKLILNEVQVEGQKPRIPTQSSARLSR